MPLWEAAGQSIGAGDIGFNHEFDSLAADVATRGAANEPRASQQDGVAGHAGHIAELRPESPGASRDDLNLSSTRDRLTESGHQKDA